MKGYDMYCEIQQLKAKGYSLRATSKKLGIHRTTVKRYWDMEIDEYDQLACKINRQHKLDFRQDTIIGWLKENEGMSAAQIGDWLKEHYAEEYSERTVSRYVSKLRDEFGIPKSNSKERIYEAIPDPPMGKQMQMDMGSKWMRTLTGGRIKIYFAAFVLSHSRYKYVYLQRRSFKAVDLVMAAKRSFAYFGGIPQEIVIDQDSIVAVDENYGDIIYTYEFERFRQEYSFSVYLCRKSDPESKGRIEKVVGYIKNNFMAHRNYPGEDELLNDLAEGWLQRTANSKMHGTTKKIPREVWEIERDYLSPIPKDILPGDEPVIFRTVRKDNTIIYGSNRYSVPLWLYGTGNDVEINVTEDGKLVVSLPGAGVICEHPLLVGRGGLKKNVDHSRDKEKTVNELQESVSAQLLGEADDFLAAIRKEKQRYARDQFLLIEKSIGNYGADNVMAGIGYCMKNRMHSAALLKDYLETVTSSKAQILNAYVSKDAIPKRIPRADSKFHVKTEKRSISEYAGVGGAL